MVLVYSIYLSYYTYEYKNMIKVYMIIIYGYTVLPLDIIY